MNCCLCGKKLSMFGNSMTMRFSDTVTGEICEDCYPHYRSLEDYADINNVEKLEKPLEYFMETLKRTSWEKQYSDIMLPLMSGTQNKIKEKKEHVKEYFPDSTSRKYGEVFLLNSETSRFSILRDGWITIPHAFDELLDYEVREDGNSITSGRTGSALVGTLLAGTAGAIIGSARSKTTEQIVNKLEIVLRFKGFEGITEAITILDYKTERSSDDYKKAVQLCDQIIIALKQILKPYGREEESDKKVPARAIYAFSVADEIRKFKELMDEGVITEEEFQKQKTKLLNLDY